MSQRVARLATADATGQPHVVPICYTVGDDSVYFTIDEKPKRAGTLKRIRNIRENPRVALVVDHYEENWRRLGWVMVRGRAELIEPGAEHVQAQTALRQRYPQLVDMLIEALPVVAIRIDNAVDWGQLTAT